MRVGLSLMRSDQLNTFHFFCPICFKFKRQFKCVPQEFRHFTFTHFGSFAILPSPVSLPFPNETQFMKHRLESRDTRAWSRFPKCVPDGQPRLGALCEIEAGLSKICRHILFREVVIIFESLWVFTLVSQVAFLHWGVMVDFKVYRTVLWILRSVFQWGSDDLSTRLPDDLTTIQVVHLETLQFFIWIVNVFQSFIQRFVPLN